MTCPGVIQNGGVPIAPVLLFLPPEGAFSPFQNNPEETREIGRKTDKTKNSFGFPGFLPETLDKTGKYSVSSSGQPRTIPVCGLTPKNPARASAVSPADVGEISVVQSVDTGIATGGGSFFASKRKLRKSGKAMPWSGRCREVLLLHP